MTNWYPITGGPSSGKTTIVNALRDLGYLTTIEHARHYIDLMRIGGKSTEQIQARRAEFQRAVLLMQIEQERALDPNATVFLDRALPDSLAYYRFLDLEPDPLLTDALQRTSYRTAFILDLLPLAPDYARTEDSVAQRQIHSLIAGAYEECGIPLVRVPVLPVRARVKFILERL